MSTDAYFKDVEQRLWTIVGILGTELSDAERDQVVEFIDVGEYGLALEMIGAIYSDFNRDLPETAFAEIRALAEVMGLNSVAEDLQNRMK